MGERKGMRNTARSGQDEVGKLAEIRGVAWRKAGEDGKGEAEEGNLGMSEAHKYGFAAGNYGTAFEEEIQCKRLNARGYRGIHDGTETKD
jgi:hypothetical protein